MLEGIQYTLMMDDLIPGERYVADTGEAFTFFKLTVMQLLAPMSNEGVRSQAFVEGWRPSGESIVFFRPCMFAYCDDALWLYCIVTE